MKARKWTGEQLRQAVADNLSVAGVIRQLGLIPAGGNYQSVQARINDLQLDTSHFTGQGWNQGMKFIPKEAQPLDEILVDGSSYQSYKLLRRLLKEGRKEHRCEHCGNTEWMGKPIMLELHHRNGKRTDNRLQNLLVLCPNCHALTDNYRGKKKSARKETSEVEAG